MTDPHLWPPETRTALALEALRAQVAQAHFDAHQTKFGRPTFPLSLTRLHDDMWDLADVAMGVFGPWVAAQIVAAEERGRTEGRREVREEWVQFGGGPPGILLGTEELG